MDNCVYSIDNIKLKRKGLDLVLKLKVFLPSIAAISAKYCVICVINSAVFATIVTKGNGLEGGFQDGIYFSRLLKCENKKRALKPYPNPNLK